MNVIEIESDLLLFIGETYQSNSTIILNGKEALLIETTGSPADALHLRELVEKTLGKTVRFIISTHFFSDHLAGLALFPQATVIAHELYRHTFSLEQFRTAEESGFFVEPDLLISDRMRLRWGRYNLELFHNPGHTMSTLGIDIPQANLLHVGDTVVGNIVYLAYSTPELLDQALERFHFRRRCHLLSSHGGIRCVQSLDRSRTYIEKLGKSVRLARNHAAPATAMLNISLDSCLDEGLEGTSFETIFHQRNLEHCLSRNLFGEPGTAPAVAAAQPF